MFDFLPWVKARRLKKEAAEKAAFDRTQKEYIDRMNAQRARNDRQNNFLSVPTKSAETISRQDFARMPTKPSDTKQPYVDDLMLFQAVYGTGSPAAIETPKTESCHSHASHHSPSTDYSSHSSHHSHDYGSSSHSSSSYDSGSSSSSYDSGSSSSCSFD